MTSAVGCTASLTFSGGRLILETARDGLLPYGRTIGYVNPKYKSPINAMVLQYILVVVYLVATPGAVYQFIIAFASWPAYIFFLLIGIGVFILRQREPALTRPYKAYSSKFKASQCNFKTVTERNASTIGYVVVFIIFSVYEILFVFVPVPSEDYPYWCKYCIAYFVIIRYFYTMGTNVNIIKCSTVCRRNGSHVSERWIMGKFCRYMNVELGMALIPIRYTVLSSHSA
jgi:amino acid transporter